MRPRLWKEAVGWGILLWLVGYVLGVLLFAFVPAGLIGWIITPFGTALALWIAFGRLTGHSLQYFAVVGAVWLLIAVIGDYVFIVKALSPPDGYYKPDVYVYYVLTLAIPLVAGWQRTAAGRMS